MDNYLGRQGLNWFYGVVEDRNDPLYLNRVRVRIYGNHTYDKQRIATPDLPWSEVMMPTTSPSLSGLGQTTHGLVEGSTVIGFYKDGAERQEPVVMGSFIGSPQSFHRIDETINEDGSRNFTQVARKATEGFNDPRLKEASSYEGTPDGPKPKHIQRPDGLTLDLKNSPRKDGLTEGVNYPRTEYLGGSDVNLLARPTDYASENSNPVKDIYPVLTLDTQEGPGLENLEVGKTEGKNNTALRDVTTYLKPKYPFNHVQESESGHLIEIDDTPDFERIHLYHRKGTRFEIDKDGNYVEKIVKDKYSVVAGNDFVTITGDVVVNITGNAHMNVTGDSTSTVGGNLKATITGTSDVTSEGKITITGNDTTEIISDTTITGKLHVTDEQTNDSTITATDSITGKEIVLDTHTHTISSGSSAGKTEVPD